MIIDVENKDTRSKGLISFQMKRFLWAPKLTDYTKFRL
jgi:hypothetical protein